MALNGEDFSEKIRYVSGSCDSLDRELGLFNPVHDPIESHVYGLRHFGTDLLERKVFSTCAVTGDRGGGLGVA